MSKRNERMNERMQSVEDIFADCDEAKNSYVSDRGAGAEKVYRRLDITFEEELAADEAAERCRDRRLKEARNRLLFLHLERLIPVLEAIVEHGENRTESIREISIKRRVGKASTRVFYYRGVAELIMLFSANKIRGLDDV